MATTPTTPNGQVTSNASAVTRIKDIDALDKLLFGGIIFFVFVIIYLSKFEPDDGQSFQVVSNILAGFAGAFFGRMKPRGDTAKPDTTTAVVTPTTGGIGGATH